MFFLEQDRLDLRLCPIVVVHAATCWADKLQCDADFERQHHGSQNTMFDGSKGLHKFSSQSKAVSGRRVPLPRQRKKE